MTFALIISDHRGVRRIIADENGIAISPAPAGGNSLHGGLALHELGFLRQSVGRQLSQRRDVVDDPNAAAVRCDHQITIARMNRQVAYRDVRQVTAFVLRPLLAAVDRNPQSELGSDK